MKSRHQKLQFCCKNQFWGAKNKLELHLNINFSINKFCGELTKKLTDLIYLLGK